MLIYYKTRINFMCYKNELIVVKHKNPSQLLQVSSNNQVNVYKLTHQNGTILKQMAHHNTLSTTIAENRMRKSGYAQCKTIELFLAIIPVPLRGGCCLSYQLSSAIHPNYHNFGSEQ